MPDQHELLRTSAPITYTRQPGASAGPAIPSPASSEGLDAYLKALRRVPVLSAAEELRLALRLRDRQDRAAAQALVLGNLRFVVHIARGYRGYRLPLADLIQEGNIGLMKAVRRFDPAAGVRLISFAVHWIKSEIHEFILRNWQIIRIGTNKAQRKLFFNLRRHRSRLGWMSRAEAQTIARELRVPLDEVLQMEARLGGAQVPLGPVSDEPDTRGLEETLADERDDFAALEDAEWTARQTGSLNSALAALDPRSRDIINRRWLAEDGALRLQSLADEYGISAERVRQIQELALRELRTRMSVDGEARMETAPPAAPATRKTEWRQIPPRFGRLPAYV